MQRIFLWLFLFLFIGCVFASPQEKILLVEDAHCDYNNSVLAPYYTKTLETLGLDYDTYEVVEQKDNGPNYDYMKNYDIVIWFTGNDYGDLFPTLTSTDQDELEKFLDNGGKLFITGQDIGLEIGGTDFYKDYLHAYFCKNKIDDYSLEGTPGEPIGDSLLINIDGGAGNQKYPSLISYAKYDLLTTLLYPKNNSFYYGLVTDKIYKYGKKCYCGDTEISKFLYCTGLNDYQGEYCVVADDGTVRHSKTQFKLPGAIKHDSGGPNGYKVVYFAFGFEGINTSEDRVKVMNRTINYLAGPKTEGTKVYVRNLDNTGWEDLNITCDPGNSVSKGGYCLREKYPIVNATCINNQLFGNITGAEFNLTNSTGSTIFTNNLSATDGNFNSSVEIVNGTINVSSLSGTYTINVHCKDSDNYWGKFDNYSFEVDTIAPLFSSSNQIVVEHYTNNEKPNIEVNYYSGQKPDYMQFSCNNQNWTDWILYQQTYSNFNITDSTYGCNSTDGNRTIYVRIRDRAGNLGLNPNTGKNYTSDWIILDRIHPKINLISPSQDSWLNTTNLTFIFNFTDLLSPNANCSLYIDEILNQTNSSVSNNTNTNFSVFDLSDGPHTWNITCKDLAGNLNSSKGSFSIDISPPKITIENPKQGVTYSGIINLLTTISDSGIGTDKAWYKIVNSSNTSQVFDQENLTAPDFDTTWNSSKATNSTGNFTFIVYANDSLGNLNSKNVSFKIDNNKPSATIVFPNEIYLNCNFNLSLKAERPSGNITNASYWIYKNLGEIVANNTTQPNSSSFEFKDFINISDWQDGNYTVIFNVTDGTNNASASSWFFIDKTLPNLTNWNLNIETDINYNDRRIYKGEEITFSINASDQRGVNLISVFISGPTNYTRNLTLSSGNSTKGIWRTSITPTTLGNYIFFNLSAEDSLGNKKLLNETEINLSFKVVEPSIKVNLGENNEIDAGQESSFNLTFNFNKTVSNQNLTLYVPDYYTNLTNWNCTNCTIDNLNLTTDENITIIKLTTTIHAGTPDQDLNSTWNLEFQGENYSETTKIKTPFLNLSVFCNGNSSCIVNQSQNFNLTVLVENIKNINHSGTARDVYLNFSCQKFSNSSYFGNLTSGSNTTKNWTEVFDEPGIYTCIFNLTDSTGKYTKILEKGIEVKDTEKPEFLGRSWTSDLDSFSSTTNSISKKFNQNETIEYFVKAKDNVGISNIIIEIYNGSYLNRSLNREIQYQEFDIWKFTNKTDELGKYNITKIYLNDTSGNLKIVNLTDFFEIIELNLTSSLSNSTIEINKTQIFSANITGNASAISKVEAKITKPSKEVDNVTLSKQNSLYKGNYTPIESGNYSVNLTVILESGINKTDYLNFTVPYGNISISAENKILIVNTTYDLPIFVIPEKGDLLNISVKINITNETIINCENESKNIGNISWKNDYQGKIVYFSLNSTQIGNTTINITAFSPNLNKSESKIINVTVIGNDTSPPIIHNFTISYNIINLNEINKFLINTTDNTAIKNVSVEITWPSNNYTNNLSANLKSNNLYELDFNKTNETGTYKFKIYSCDVIDNCNNTTTGEFNVTNEYYVFPSISGSNKGTLVEFNITVKNIRGEEVKDFNLTLIIYNTKENITVVNNTQTNYATYRIKYDDPPPSVYLGDPKYADYTTYIYVKKNKNSGSSIKSFTVSEDLPTTILYPDTSYYPPNSPVNLSVSVKDSDGNIVSTASVTAHCPDCSKEYARLEYNSSTKTYVGNNIFVSPEKDFDIFIYSSSYFGGNKGYYSKKYLTSKPVTDGTSSGGGGNGGGGNLGQTMPTCNCTEWSLNVPADCGSHNCSSNELYQKRICEPRGCDIEERCIPFPACKKLEAKDFEFEISESSIKIERGYNKTILLKFRSLSKRKITLTLKINKSCCSLYTLPKTIDLDPDELSEVPLLIDTSLSRKPGNYLITFLVCGENLTKKRILNVQIEENKDIDKLRDNKKRLEELKREIKKYGEYVDVSNLFRLVDKADKFLNEANLSIARDDLQTLKRNLEEADLTMKEIENKLLSLKIKKFLLENKWNFMLIALIILLITYFITQIIYPYFKLSKELKSLKEKEQELTNSRKETEKKYFLRKIDEKTFRDILVRTQQKIFEIRGEIKRKKENKERILKEKLGPIALLIWIKSLLVFFPKYLKSLATKSKNKIIKIRKSKEKQEDMLSFAQKLKEEVIKLRTIKIKQVMSNPEFINRKIEIKGELSFIKELSRDEFLYRIEDETGELYIFSNRKLKEGIQVIEGVVKKSAIGQMYIEIKD